MKTPTDSEMLDWIAMRCFLPNDHPEDDLIVIVPERFSKLGSFTCNPENDQQALRDAIQNAMNCYANA